MRRDEYMLSPTPTMEPQSRLNSFANNCEVKPYLCASRRDRLDCWTSRIHVAKWEKKTQNMATRWHKFLKQSPQCWDI